MYIYLSIYPLTRIHIYIYIPSIAPTNPHQEEAARSLRADWSTAEFRSNPRTRALYIDIDIFICIYVFMYICMYMCIYIYIYIYIYVCVCISIYIYIHHIYMYIYIYIDIDIDQHLLRTFKRADKSISGSNCTVTSCGLSSKSFSIRFSNTRSPLARRSLSPSKASANRRASTGARP